MVSGFVIHLRIRLSELEGDWLLGALGVDRMEEVIWRLWMQSSSVGTDTGLPLDPMVGLGILRGS